jgi:hypothetical protein
MGQKISRGTLSQLACNPKTDRRPNSPTLSRCGHGGAERWSLSRIWGNCEVDAEISLVDDPGQSMKPDRIARRIAHRIRECSDFCVRQFVSDSLCQAFIAFRVEAIWE